MTRYEIDPDRSRVEIDARSSLHPIHSRTDGLEGEVSLDFDDGGKLDPSSAPAGRLSLPVSKLRSGNRLEERELQRRIEARRFPTIDGTLSAIDAAGEDGHYRVAGELTFRGVSRPQEGTMTIRPVDGTTVELAGSSRFDIRDFGMEPPKVLMLRVEPVVEVRVEITARAKEL
ncbi:MAG: YceI family protein [Acidimicrobiales bacterium]